MAISDTIAAAKAVSFGITVKVPCALASTANIVSFSSRSSTEAVDGVVPTTGDRILVNNQDNATENGIYVVNSTSWSRAPDFDGPSDCTRATIVFVNYGATYANKPFYIDSTGINVPDGSSNISFVQFAGPL